MVTFLPALEFVFTRAEALQAVLSRPAAYSGLVATSPRGCLAASIAFKALSSTLSPDSFSALLTQWTAVPFYTVGEASAALLTSAFPLTATAVGGNAAALARFIVEQRRVDRTDGLPKPLLVLSGQLRREELFDGLRAGGVVYEEMEVYETQRRPGLTEDVRRLMEEGVEGDTGQERWMVFFSPSGVEAVHEGVGSGVDHGERMRRWRIAALGNTSAAAVRKVRPSHPSTPAPFTDGVVAHVHLVRSRCVCLCRRLAGSAVLWQQCLPLQLCSMPWTRRSTSTAM